MEEKLLEIKDLSVEYTTDEDIGVCEEISVKAALL